MAGSSHQPTQTTNDEPSAESRGEVGEETEFFGDDRERGCPSVSVCPWQTVRTREPARHNRAFRVQLQSPSRAKYPADPREQAARTRTALARCGRTRLRAMKMGSQFSCLCRLRRSGIQQPVRRHQVSSADIHASTLVTRQSQTLTIPFVMLMGATVRCISSSNFMRHLTKLIERFMSSVATELNVIATGNRTGASL